MIQTDKLLVLIINLDKRSDRYTQLAEKFVTNKVCVKRISAVTPLTLEYANLDEYGTTPSVVSACWESHKRALSSFLQTDEEICLILEDDAKFHGESIKILDHKKEFLELDFDIFQIGFVLSNGKLDLGKSFRLNKFRVRARSFFARKMRIALRIYGKVNYKFSEVAFAKIVISFFNFLRLHKRFLNLLARSDSSYIRNEKSKFLGKGNILQQSDFQAGAHAYLVNRKTASFLISINTPCFLATDLLYIALARAENLRFVRVTNSLVGQDEELQSDIDKRSRLFG